MSLRTSVVHSGTVPLLFLGLLSVPCLAAEPGPAAGLSAKPNIVVIVADDLGYGELGSYGGTQVPTPNLDSLAKSGVRFTSGYVSCPVCSPTRAGLLTGRYQQRFGHEFNGGTNPRVRFGLPLSESTMADRLRAAGYRTVMVGKWHLGAAPEYQPQRRGFDEFFGFLGGAHEYFPPRVGASPRGPILRGTETVDEPEYLTRALTREAVASIRRHRSEPFFLYLTYNAVHAPLQAPSGDLERHAGIAETKRKSFAAMLSVLDEGVGAVRAALRDAGIEKNTLVFFLSDNGGPTPSTTSRNGPLRGFKAQVLEGGIRVPFLVEWPETIPAGKTLDTPVLSLDILPTALAAAGVKLPAEARVDGVDLLPWLRAKEPATQASKPHEFLYWRFGAQAAVRKGPWKLVRQGAGAAWALYDLAGDVGETKDLAREKPESAGELLRAWEAWNRGLADPLWGPAGAALKEQDKNKAKAEAKTKAKAKTKVSEETKAARKARRQAAKEARAKASEAVPVAPPVPPVPPVPLTPPTAPDAKP